MSFWNVKLYNKLSRSYCQWWKATKQIYHILTVHSLLCFFILLFHHISKGNILFFAVIHLFEALITGYLSDYDLKFAELIKYTALSEIKPVVSNLLACNLLTKQASSWDFLSPFRCPGVVKSYPLTFLDGFILNNFSRPK